MTWLILLAYAVLAAVIIGAYVYGYRCGHSDGKAEILAELDEHLGDHLDPACRICGCTDEQACPAGCSWAPDPEGGDLCSACEPAAWREFAQAVGR